MTTRKQINIKVRRMSCNSMAYAGSDPINSFAAVQGRFGKDVPTRKYQNKDEFRKNQQA